MKPDQDPERNPSREAAAMKGRVPPGPAEPREPTGVKGRVTPVPAERPADDRAGENRPEAEEVSRREALKGRVDPASAEPAPGDPGRDGDRAVNGDGQAARPARTGTAARATTGADTDGRGAAGEGRAHRTGDGPASGLSKGPVPRGTGGTPSGGGPADPEDRAGDAAGRDERMLPLDEHDKFSMRMRHAVGGFVDGPQASVEEADHVLEELAGRFTEAVTRRRRDLRTSWQSGDAGKATDTDTERLRLALRDYREMTERLLRI